MYDPNVLLFLGAICGFIFLAKKAAGSLNTAIPLGLSIIISLLYVASLADILPATTYGIYAFGIAAFLFFIWRHDTLVLGSHKAQVINPEILKQVRDDCYKRYYPKELIALLTIILIYYLRVAPSYYACWDDISSWGIFIKDVFYHDGLIRPGEEYSSIQYFFHYPKLMSTVHYFALKSMPFTEGNNIFVAGLVVILFTGVLLVRDAFWRNILLIPGALAPMVLFTTALYSIYIDAIVGVIFGAAVSILIQENSPKKLLFIIPLLFILPAVKEVGFHLAYAAIAGYCIVQLLQGKFNFLYAAIASLAPYLSQVLWQQYLSGFPTEKTNKAKLGLLELWHKIINYRNSEDDKAILFGFLKSLWGFIHSEGAIVLYVLVAVSIYLVRKYDRAKLKELYSYYLVFFLFFLAYLLFRLSLYYTHYSLSEAARGASALRYYATFAVVFIFIAGTYIKSVLEKISHTELIKLRKAGIVLGVAFFAIIAFKLTEKPPLTLSKDRIAMEKIATDLKNLDIYQNNILVGFDDVNSFNCLQFYLEFADGRNSRRLCDQCSATAKGDIRGKLGKDFFDQINLESFNDPQGQSKNKNNYDLLYVANATEETLKILSDKLGIDIIPAQEYVFRVYKGRFFQIY